MFKGKFLNYDLVFNDGVKKSINDTCESLLMSFLQQITNVFPFLNYELTRFHVLTKYLHCKTCIKDNFCTQIFIIYSHLVILKQRLYLDSNIDNVFSLYCVCLFIRCLKLKSTIRYISIANIRIV